jgi:hypothetical protein
VGVMSKLCSPCRGVGRLGASLYFFFFRCMNADDLIVAPTPTPAPYQAIQVLNVYSVAQFQSQPTTTFDSPVDSPLSTFPSLLPMISSIRRAATLPG